jgi:hypothetical protein
MSCLCVPIDPEELAHRIATLMNDAAPAEDVPGTKAVLGQLAEQHYKLALAALEQAKLHAKIADFWMGRKE